MVGYVEPWYWIKTCMKICKMYPASADDLRTRGRCIECLFVCADHYRYCGSYLPSIQRALTLPMIITNHLCRRHVIREITKAYRSGTVGPGFIPRPRLPSFVDPTNPAWIEPLIFIPRLPVVRDSLMLITCSCMDFLDRPTGFSHIMTRRVEELDLIGALRGVRVT